MPLGSHWKKLFLMVGRRKGREALASREEDEAPTDQRSEWRENAVAFHSLYDSGSANARQRQLTPPTTSSVKTRILEIIERYYFADSETDYDFLTGIDESVPLKMLKDKLSCALNELEVLFTISITRDERFWLADEGTVVSIQELIYKKAGPIIELPEMINRSSHTLSSQ